MPQCVQCDCTKHQTGDINNDGILNVLDVTKLINYVFKGGAVPPKDPACVHINRGDVNCTGNVQVLDVVYLINRVFKHGPKPCDPCLCTPYPTNCP